MFANSSLRRLAWIALILFVWLGSADTTLGQEKIPSTPSGGTAGSTEGTSTGLTKHPGRPLLGDRGPDFKLKTFSGEVIELKEFRGEESVVLVFTHRRDGSLASYDALGTELREKDIKLMFVCRQGAKDKKLDEGETPVLYDRWGDVAKSYGSLNLVSRDIVPSIVILDQNGYIRFYIAGYMPKADALGETVVAVLKPYGQESAQLSGGS
jgi:peroxiredoxin